jgi:hypothetical protein
MLKVIRFMCEVDDIGGGRAREVFLEHHQVHAHYRAAVASLWPSKLSFIFLIITYATRSTRRT